MRRLSHKYDSRLIGISFFNSLGVLIYVLSVLWLVRNAEALFGSTGGILSSIPALIFYFFSVLIIGLLVFGWPLWLFIRREKRESLLMLIFSCSWLIVFLVPVLIVKIMAR